MKLTPCVYIIVHFLFIYFFFLIEDTVYIGFLNWTMVKAKWWLLCCFWQLLYRLIIFGIVWSLPQTIFKPKTNHRSVSFPKSTIDRIGHRPIFPSMWFVVKKNHCKLIFDVALLRFLLNCWPSKFGFNSLQALLVCAQFCGSKFEFEERIVTYFYGHVYTRRERGGEK